MKRKITFLMVIFFSLGIIIFFSNYKQVNNGNANSDLIKIDLYDFFYTTQAISKIGNQELDKSYADLLKNYDVEQFFYDGNNGALYDLWLYTHSVEANKLASKKASNIIRFVNSLQSNDGYFLLYNTQDKNMKETNYLLSTKMATDIYRQFGHSIPNKNKIEQWLNSLLQNIKKEENEDFISLGSIIYLAKEIEHNIYIDDYKPENYSNYARFINHLLALYNEEQESTEKYDTALKLNNLFENNPFIIEKNKVSRYIKSIQLENGSFPLYGVTPVPDTLTTFLVVNLLKELDITFPKKDSLKNYLENTQKNSIYGINLKIDI
ncbi:hypothetical protein M5W83_20865 [Paenibacillus thiaminolyticus]|uniref:Uncharacterized protein n=1 Tax=Paenibacillus thiaminolyticus TaxID=49283 RepID=A0AAP9DV42_PANTH|nr:hypothetical protein [Paenibacillus thiaminolyticus]MCY9534925.1 hypothetical protein [Paenibacillus thiaminolyticus]MCY9604297.1 hypothetical protein [Paenibacillus thiaminolyticus]MCY9609605.1 hypothetical protein [Paenibacillus thiaminolyticus]MCY9612445.1 hypothetical protein [Paenibacillus thiaminolyticus]MCY9617426.1 hypothetical protein [Paenibacillus thiaminolyticus]